MIESRVENTTQAVEIASRMWKLEDILDFNWQYELTANTLFTE